MAEKTAAEDGRDRLIAWQDAQPDNWFEADEALQGYLQRLYGPAYEDRAASLSASAALLAQKTDPLVCQMERQGNQPRLDRYDGVGQRTEDVLYDGRYREVGQHLYGTGVISMLGEPGNVLQNTALGYINNQLGEAGHNCPIACTAGVVRVLTAVGSEELKERYLPGLLKSDYDERLDGAQFMTEVQGGSDVGANAVVATPIEGQPGQYRIDGEKWFCSNCTADIFLMTARFGGDGTRGLGLFLVPRVLEDGSTNHFGIRRLKEKLGTRAMASGEIDFNGAVGWTVGPVEQGFKSMMNWVINTSRLMNGSGTLAMARRALTVAWTYAKHRGAFGSEIINYPLVQETLADMRTEVSVLLASHLHLAQLVDRRETGETLAEDEAGYFRVALNLNKYRTAVSAGEVIRSAIEVLGGNGAIETFSPLPRLLRDNVVYENWEGTHNTLCMQVLRDMSRLGVGTSFVGNLVRRFGALIGSEWASKGVAVARALGDDLSGLSSVTPAVASLRMRPLADRMSFLMAACAQAEHVHWLSRSGADAAQHEAMLSHFWTRRITGRSGLATAAYVESLSGLVSRI